MVPMFFALSGYLVSGSLERNNLVRFLGLRILRIVPALAFEIFLCALVLGVSFTKLPLYEYFVSREFIVYFGNIVGWIHFTLPGVFEGKVINLQLWTIPYELECYAAIAVISMLGLFRRRSFNLVLVSVLTVGISYLTWDPMAPQNNLNGRALVLAFLFGVVIYQYRDKLAFSPSLAVVATILSVVLLSRANYTILAGAPIAYLTVYIGLQQFPPIRFGDLSYGVYLFHYPILRTVNEITGNGIGIIAGFAIVLVLSAGCALISWNLIERPLLEQKKAILGPWVDDLNTAVTEAARSTLRFMRFLPAQS
ncbi:acyltransferase [Siculibacillus lacustris]|uniref:Acyltransferase n=1 Tax=Siculibacillus lacustris TaxID=1549641 RepID=A0A4Q9VCE4_9HYPH|nr:acyltransferase [Siculibacillus lacustris]TBW32114.1 acyltransferase [Siculibacillus lacustris]